MRRSSGEAGYLLMDVIVGFGLMGFVLLAISYLYGSTFLLARDINSRLGRQQDVRLALDRVARALRETTDGFGRLRVYSPTAGCAGAYEGCLGFVTAREACVGPFQRIDGAPDWQATLYLWRDTRSNELRLRCDTETTFPVLGGWAFNWPPMASRNVPLPLPTFRAFGSSWQISPIRRTEQDTPLGKVAVR